MNASASAATAGSVISGLAWRIIFTIIFSKPIARNETAFAMLEKAGFSSFHRNGTSYSSNAKFIFRICRSVTGATPRLAGMGWSGGPATAPKPRCSDHTHIAVDV